MPWLPFHPAPGFGELLPGFFVVPQNPIRDVGTPMVPSVQAAVGNRPAYRAHLAELMPGKFAVPQNPLRHALATVGMSGLTSCSTCGECYGSCGCASGTGLSSVDSRFAQARIQSPGYHIWDRYYGYPQSIEHTPEVYWPRGLGRWRGVD